ncbi:MAG: TIGR00153 family protein [Simkaniaceae bacterium]|nr:TIGR00153 family protein [Simkaniaceae bacterium]
MLTTIARLFGKSPFLPLQSHMKKVSLCIKKLTEIFEHLPSGSSDALEPLVKELSHLEHEADLTKNDIRNHLPKSLFLPIDRGQFLEILAIQDSISDQAERIGNHLVLYPLEKELYGDLRALYEQNVKAFWDARTIVKELQGLLQTSFGGMEAEKVKTIIENTSYLEHEADTMKYEMLKKFFSGSENRSGPVFYLYIQLVEKINEISHISESLANRIRMILELK